MTEEVPQNGDLTGRTLGGFEILRKLGAGGMATVYKAHEGSLNRVVALKVISAYLAKQPDFVARFYREARAAAQLSHPNIVQIYAVGDEGGVPYFSMEYVKGQSIQSLIETEGFLTPRRVVTILDQTAQALAAAHDAGIVHRDIKPSNIMLDAAGRVKVADFGIAQVATENKLTQTGMMLGTPGYMSPEQCLGEKLDARSDIYSLGVAAYEMLSGRSPYRAETPAALVLQIVDAEPPPLAELNPTVPPGLQDIVAKMLRKKPRERFQSAEDLIDALKRVDLADARGAEQTIPRRAPAAADVEPTRIKPAATPARDAPERTSGRGQANPAQSGASNGSFEPLAIPQARSKRLRPSLILALTGVLGGAAAAAVLLSSGLLGTQSVGEPAGSTAGEETAAAVTSDAAPASASAGTTQAQAPAPAETQALVQTQASTEPAADSPSAAATANSRSDAATAQTPNTEASIAAAQEAASESTASSAGPAATSGSASTSTPTSPPTATAATNAVDTSQSGASSPSDATSQPSATVAAVTVTNTVQPAAVRGSSGDLAAKSTSAPKPSAPAPKSIVTLIEGDYEHVDLVRVGIENAFTHEGFQIIDFVPPGTSIGDRARFQIVSTAKVVGSRELVYFGRTQLLQTVALTVQATDLATGMRASGPYSASIEYTSLNLQEKLTQGASNLAESVIRDLEVKTASAR